MQLESLESGARFKIVGWEKGPTLAVRYAIKDRVSLTVLENTCGDTVDLKTGVLCDNGKHDLEEIMKTTYVLPATIEVRKIRVRKSK